MTDDDLQNLYDTFFKFASDQCLENSPMAVAGVMIAQALTIYKSAMSEEEYNLMVDSISAQRSQIKTFERPILQ